MHVNVHNETLVKDNLYVDVFPKSMTLSPKQKYMQAINFECIARRSATWFR